MNKLLVIIVVLTAFLFPMKCYAEEDYGQEEIVDALPDSVQDYLDENEITPDNSGALSLTPQSVIEEIWGIFSSEAVKPLKMLCMLIGVILLCAIVESMGDGAGSSTGAFRIVGILACSGMMCTYIADSISYAVETLNAAGTFMIAFVPAFAGIIAINGQTTTATVFGSILIIATQVFSQLSVTFLMPLSSSVLGISVAGAVNPDLKIGERAAAVKKAAVWGIGLLMTVFVGLLGMQSFITSSADSVAMKAAKFAVSNSVPIVGGAVSDALSTVKGSLALVKSSMGTFGIIAGVSLVMPALASVICYKLALTIAAAVSDMFGVSSMTSLLKSGESVITIIMSLLFCFMIMIIVSTALILAIGSGVA